MNSLDWFSKWNIYKRDAKAITDFESGKSYTFYEINNMANGLANYFVDTLHIDKGDRIAVLAENCIEYAVLFSVAQKLGIIIIPLNYRLTAKELDYIIGNSEPKMLITQNSFLEKIHDATAAEEVKIKMNLDNLGQLLEGFLTADEVIFSNRKIREDDTLFILYTSGTTAFPKGALYTHKMLFWNSINTQLRLNITSDDISINATPPFHTGAWNVLYSPFMHHGAHTILMKNFNADAILRIIEEEEVTIWWAVPTMMKLLAESELFKKVNFEKLRYLVVGGESLPLDVINKWHERGVPVRQGYGLTEVGPNITSLNHEDAKRKLGSIGTPNFYIETKIVDEKGNTLEGECSGELLLKGPNVTPGYWKNEEATKSTIKDGWFSTGDIVKRDSEGFIYVIDRIKNMYISGAENVYPAEVEHLIRKHPEIIDVAIIGVPDEKWGEAGKAFIVKVKDSSLTAEDVKNYCLQNLAKYKIPKHIQFMEALPTSDTGKINRKILKTL